MGKIGSLLIKQGVSDDGDEGKERRNMEESRDMMGWVGK